jgi:putative phage-type endonuclease
MNRLVITPPNRAAWLALRVEDVTSTESAMLFGLSPYGTAFELWHAKHDGIARDYEATERMEWGSDLEPSIAAALARRYGVIAEPFKDYVRLVDARMGASFDWKIVGLAQGEPDAAQDQVLRAMFLEHGPGLLEIKNVDSLVFRDAWLKEDKSIEAPGHIDVQVQHQLHVAGLAWACVGVLVGGNRGRILVKLRDETVGQALEARIVQFWETVKTGIAPQPSYPDDAEFVCKLYGHATPGKVFDGRGNEALNALAADYRAAADREKIAKEDKDVAKAKMLEIIGEAEKAMLDAFTISAGMVAPGHVEYDRAGYRNWKLTPKGKGK